MDREGSVISADALKTWLGARFFLPLFVFIASMGCQADRCGNQSDFNPDTLSAYEARVVDSARYAFYATNGHLTYNYQGAPHYIFEFDAPVSRLRYNGDTLIVTFALKADSIIDMIIGIDSFVDIAQLEKEQNRNFIEYYSASFGFYTKNDTLTLLYNLFAFQDVRGLYESYYGARGVYVEFNNFCEKQLKEHLAAYSGELNCWLKERAIRRGWWVDKSK